MLDIPHDANPANFYGTPEFERRRLSRLSLPVRRDVREPTEAITPDEALRRFRAARDRLYPPKRNIPTRTPEALQASASQASRVREARSSTRVRRELDFREAYGPSTLLYLVHRCQRRLVMTAIVKATVLHFEASTSEILSKDRMAGLVYPRHTAMYLCRVIAGASLVEVGAFFSGRDHTTAKHAIDKIAGLMKSDGGVPADVAAIVARLGLPGLSI